MEQLELALTLLIILIFIYHIYDSCFNISQKHLTHTPPIHTSHFWHTPFRSIHISHSRSHLPCVHTVPSTPPINTASHLPFTPPIQIHTAHSLPRVTRRSSGMAPRACVRVYARVLVPPNLYVHT